MDQNAIISVIIPNFGHLHYLMDAIQSILDQTYQDFEILILNDDEWSLKAFELIDPRIKVFNRINSERLTSEERLNLIADQLQLFWCYQDADGVSYPTRLATSLRYLRATSSDIITTDGIYRFRQFFQENPKYTKIDNQYGVGAMSSVFARKEVLQQIPFSKKGYGSDGAWWYEIKQSKKFKYSHMNIPTYIHLDYSSRFRKFKSIPILRKLYRLLFLRPQIRQYLKHLRAEEAERWEADYGNV